MLHAPAAEDGFSREGYLLANPDLYDVAAKFPSWDAHEHLVMFGVAEKRYVRCRYSVRR